MSNYIVKNIEEKIRELFCGKDCSLKLVSMGLWSQDLLVYRSSDGRQFAAKVSRPECLNILKNEVKAMEEVSKHYPYVIPKYYGSFWLDGRLVIVNEYVDFSPFTFYGARSISLESSRCFVDFLVGKEGKGAGTASFPEGFVEFFEGHEDWPNVTQFIPEWAGKLSNITCIPQHGDLALTNVYIYEEKILVIDWEDFGFVNIPGFDLFVFLLSCSDQNITIMKSYFDESGQPIGLKNIIQRASIELHRVLGEPWENFIPLYILLLLFLKHKLGYGKLIQEKIGFIVSKMIKEVGVSGK